MPHLFSANILSKNSIFYIKKDNILSICILTIYFHSAQLSFPLKKRFRFFIYFFRYSV